ncbi:MAG TPA: MFS transporter [Verrucomicrobiae bacterium]|jgi:fucose permease
MANRREIITIYAAGLIQGVALVTFPAASTVFTSSSEYGLSSTEYGCLFIPQAVTAIASALLGASLTRQLGSKTIYLLGLASNFLAMTLLVVSQFAMKEHALAYGILLGATAGMGAGFGFTVPALNTFVAAFFPKKTDKAILALNALLGLGTALAPAFVALFVHLNIWWCLPVLVGALLLGLLLFSLNQTLNTGASSQPKKSNPNRSQLPARFWVFAAFAFVYGVCETMNGNWAVPYMTKYLGSSAALAALALAIFWGMVTAGRLGFAASEQWLPEKLVFRVLPFGLTGAFLAMAFVPKHATAFGILIFALNGLGCSALLPLAISFSQKELTTISTSVTGGVIACYQVGYGVAAFGVGPLQTSAEMKLNIIYGGTAGMALAMGALAFWVTFKKPAR